MSQNNLGRVIYMTIVTTLYFSISLSVDTIFPEISEQNGFTKIGQISLIFIFLSEMCSNSFGQYFIKTKNYNRQFFICSIFPPLGILPVILMEHCHQSNTQKFYCEREFLFPITILGFLFQGGGLGFIFMLQNTYTSAASTDQDRDQIFGLCYCIFGSSYLISSLLSNQTIEVLGQLNFFYMLMGLQLLLSFLFLFVKNEGMDYVKIVDENVEIKKSLLDSLEQEKNIRSTFQIIKSSIQETKIKLKEKSVKLLLPHFILTGVVIGIQLGQFYLLILQTLDEKQDDLIINKKTYAVFIAVGIGEVMSGPFVSFMKGQIQLRTYMISYAVYTLISIIIAIVNFYLKSYVLCFIIGFSWGIVDNFGLNTSVMAISQYWGDSLPMFGVYLFTQNVAVSTYILTAIIVESQMMIIGFTIALICSIAAIIGNVKFFQYVENDKSILIERGEF